MKRAFPQESFSDLISSPFEGVADQADQGFSGNRRRVRTSAAMLGLALSMGASGALLPRQGAVAAGLPSASLSPTLSTVPAGFNTPVVGMMPVATLDASSTVYHTVQEGQTLSQIASVHRVEVNTVEQANGVSADTLLQVGQVLRIPVSAEATPAISERPQFEAEQFEAGQPVQTDFAQADFQLKASQDASLETVHQKRQELQQVLELSPDQAHLSAEATVESQASVESKVDAQVLARVAPTQTASASDGDTPTSQSLIADNGNASPPDTAWNSETIPAQVEADSSLETRHDATGSRESQPELALNAEINPGISATANAQGDLEADSPTRAEADLAAEETLQVSASLEGVSPASWMEQSYDIREGDTIANIAEAYGVSTADLVQINELENPDFIVAGESLLVPQSSHSSEFLRSAGVDTVAAVDGPILSSGVNASSSTERLARLQATVLNPIGGEAELQNLRQSMLPNQYSLNSESSSATEQGTAVIGAVPEDTATDSLSADSYMANLMAEVDAAQQFAISELQSERTFEVGITAGETSEELAEGLPVAVNPQFDRQLASQGVAAAESADSALGEPTPVMDNSVQLLAAAPLGSEAYAPITPNPAAGQSVSPNMPALPNADEFLPELPNYFNGYIWPTTGTLTSGYGPRWGRMHRGIDIAGPVGTPIVAAAAGVVERAGWNSGGYGNLVDIRHADGSLTRYAHNSRLLVSSGQQVAQGQQIAEMGSTGYSTGPHLHFEVHIQGQGTVNPISYLPGR